MDRKDMIHIDDLVRGQLSEREEDERPGAWLHMRELLDKNMPAGTPAPFNWRRFGGYTVLLSLLTVVVTGGYMMMQNPAGFVSGTIPTDITTSVATTSSPAIHADEASIPYRNLSEKETASSPIDDNKGIITASSAKEVAATTTGAAFSAGRNAGHGKITTTTHKFNEERRTDLPAITPNNNSGNEQQARATMASQDDKVSIIRRDESPLKKVVAQPNNSVTVTLPDRKNEQIPTTAIAVGPSLTQQQQHTTATRSTVAAKTESQNNTTQRHETAVNSNNGYKNTIQRKSTIPGELHGKNNDSYLVTHKDTVEKINLVYRTVIDPISRVRTRVLDTASIEQMIVEKHIPASKAVARSEQKTSNTRLTTPANTIPSVPGEQPTTGQAEEIAVQAKHVKQQRKGQTFQDMFMETKYTLSQAPFYLGITGGINAMSSGGKVLPGIQLGLSGELELNERWSVYTELKYINRFNNGKTINNPYVDKGYITSVGTNETKYARDSINHYFNFSTIGTGNLPITVKYSVNRLFLLAGVDIVYHFRMNAEEVSTIAATGVRDTTVLAGQKLPTSWNQAENMMQLNDLGARLGIGYLLGVGYKATPNLHLDLRLTHTFWDNAGTSGSKKVSDQLFRVPSMQFSLGYRLGGTRRTP